MRNVGFDNQADVPSLMIAAIPDALADTLRCGIVEAMRLKSTARHGSLSGAEMNFTGHTDRRLRRDAGPAMGLGAA